MPAIPVPPPAAEAARLAALRELQVLDTLPEGVYDDIALLASQICGTPIALVSLVDADRQWFKARVGLVPTETHRDLAFCAHAIAADAPVFIVEDARLDARFRDNPLVTGDPRIRFYAGAPVVMPDGHALGTVCVIDTAPRVLDAAQIGALQALARQTTALLELRVRTLASEQHARALEQLSAQAAEERRRSAEMLEIVLRGGNLGLWELQVGSGSFTANDREYEMLGHTRGEAAAAGLNWRELVHPDDWPVLDAAIVSHLAGRATFYSCEHRMRHRDGHWVWTLSHAVIAERDAGGAPSRIVGTHMDVSARVRNRHALQSARDLLQRMGTLAKIGGWELDLPSGKLSWTEEVYRIHELDPATEPSLVKGLDFYAPAARPVISAAIQDAVDHGRPWDIELPFITATGRELFVRAQGEAVMQGGRALRLFGTFQDVTERRRVEQALALSEHRLSLALSRPGLSVFDWDVARNRVYRGANFAAMQGAPAAEQVCTIEGIQASAHPADVLRVRDAISDAVRGPTDGYDVEYRVRHRDGHWVWVHGAGRVTERGLDGRALRVSGTDEDVSAAKAAQRALIDSQRRLRVVTDNLPALIAHIDNEQRYVFLNAHMHSIFGTDVEASIGRTVRETRGEETYAKIAPHIEAALRGERTSFSYAVQVNGRSVHHQANYIPDVDAAGQVQGFYAMTFDISELQETQRQLELLARMDTLTALPNRRQFDERMAEALLRARRLRQTVAVMFLDIDHFKRINDSLGHAGGDAVLCEFARRLQGCVRATDTVARLAGDEFVVLLEGLNDGAELGTLAQKVVDCVRAPFEIEGRRVDVTTSVGVATCLDAGSTGAEVLARADAALYQAKSEGRDRYAIA